MDGSHPPRKAGARVHCRDCGPLVCQLKKQLLEPEEHEQLPVVAIKTLVGLETWQQTSIMACIGGVEKGHQQPGRPRRVISRQEFGGAVFVPEVEQLRVIAYWGLRLRSMPVV